MAQLLSKLWEKEGKVAAHILIVLSSVSIAQANFCVVRLRVQVNGAEIFSNYNGLDPATTEDMKTMTPEERKKLTDDESLITARIDDY